MKANVILLLASQIAGFLEIWYLMKEVNDEVYFWHADKHWSFPQVDTIVLGIFSQIYPKYPK